MLAAGAGLNAVRHSTETHGTGTPLGDSIEVGALMHAFGSEQLQTFGAKSSRFGHTEAAAGSVGLLKLLASLQTAYMVPNLHFSISNPKLGIESFPVLLPSQVLTHFDMLSDRAHDIPASVHVYGMSGNQCAFCVGYLPALCNSCTFRASCCVLQPGHVRMVVK